MEHSLHYIEIGVSLAAILLYQFYWPDIPSVAVKKIGNVNAERGKF
jgi:hypothetical protein